MRRRTAPAGTLATLLALVLGACGSAAPPEGGPEPWAASHPDPPNMQFLAPQGLCTVTVRYPQDAPGEIVYAGQTYVQRERVTPAANPGKQVATSGDWTLYQPSDSALLLVTPSGAYRYSGGANCGSNSSAPSG